MSAFDDLKNLILTSPDSNSFLILNIWNDASALDAQRYIVAIENGGSSDEDVQRSTFNLWFISRVNESAESIIDFDNKTKNISKFLAKNFTNNEIINISVVASSGSPRASIDGRFWVTMDLQILYCITE